MTCLNSYYRLCRFERFPLAEGLWKKSQPKNILRSYKADRPVVPTHLADQWRQGGTQTGWSWPGTDLGTCRGPWGTTWPGYWSPPGRTWRQIRMIRNIMRSRYPGIFNNVWYHPPHHTSYTTISWRNFLLAFSCSPTIPKWRLKFIGNSESNHTKNIGESKLKSQYRPSAVDFKIHGKFWKIQNENLIRTRPANIGVSQYPNHQKKFYLTENFQWNSRYFVVKVDF